MEDRSKIKILSFFGPPGSGKGTIAQRCVRELGYKMLSTGDLLRKHIQDQSELGKMVAEYVNKGHLIPDDLITQMVLSWLRGQISPSRVVILDGFPRTSGQAALIMRSFSEEDVFADVDFRIINFDLSESEIVRRISSRLVCSNNKCQEVYSSLVKMPRQVGVCDMCKAPLLKRQDDEAVVVRERLNVFAKSRKELLDFYTDMQAKIVNFAVPSGDPEAVFKSFMMIV